MSQVIKAFVTMSMPKVFVHGVRHLRNQTSISKELIKQSGVSSSDLLINNLKSANTMKNLFEVVNTHHKIMNSKHVMQALRSIFVLQRQENSDLSTQEILTHPDFEKICTNLKAQAGVIEINDVIEALKVINFVGVPSDSTIYQVLLQLIRHKVNELTLPQIIFLSFLLKHANSSPLVDALQIALPIVFDVQLPIKMSHDNMTNLAEYLQYVSKHVVSSKSVEIIIMSMLKCRDELDSKTAISVIWSICDMQSNEVCKPLLRKALKTLNKNFKNTRYYDIETTLSKLVYKYSSFKTPFYYDEEFFDNCANYVAKNDLGFEYAVHLLRKFIKMNHINRNLLNYVSEKISINPDLILNGDPLHVYSIVCAMAMSEFKPKQWYKLKNTIAKIDITKLIRTDFNMLKFANSLHVLEIYIPEVIEKCFNERYLQKILKGTLTDAENVLLAYQALNTFKPELAHFVPSKFVSTYVLNRIKPVTDYPLEGSLLKIFGGERYVKSGIMTKLFHHIDHVITLKNGSPLPVNIPKGRLENIVVLQDTQIVLILALNSLHYTINTNKIIGTTLLMIKTLEAQGYFVVPICMLTWNSLLEFEKLPYIVREIESRTEELGCKSDFIR